MSIVLESLIFRSVGAACSRLTRSHRAPKGAHLMFLLTGYKRFAPLEQKEGSLSVNYS